MNAGDEQRATVLHVYIPKHFKKNLDFKSGYLIGSYSSQRYADSEVTKDSLICTVSIYGAFRRLPPNHHSPALTDLDSDHDQYTQPLYPRHDSPQILGHFGMLENMLDLKTVSIVWTRFSCDGSLEEVFYNCQRVAEGDVSILEYDPGPLSRCIFMRSSRTMGEIPDVVVNSFRLVTFIPEDGTKDFCRLIPEDKSWRGYGSFCAREISGHEQVPKLKVRSYGLEEVLYKFMLAVEIISQNHVWVNALNIVSLIMLDIFLGILLTAYLKKLVPTYDEYEKFCKVVLELLLQLLEWLSGAPAGLKLNAELNSLFHSFYSYHLHLWEGYIDLVKPVLKMLLHVVVNMGSLGITVQLSMAKDLLSVTTFHIYCLYIYATRLFYIELNTLKSLGRLIMGRKWNPLRQRIDSVTLSVSELFLGAFGFTVALFLLPTIFVYYAVFLALRLPIVLLEFLLHFFVQLFDTLRIVSAVLSSMNSKWIADDTYLVPVNSKENEKYSHYEIRTQPASIGLYKVPPVREFMTETISKILESRVITN